MLVTLNSAMTYHDITQKQSAQVTIDDRNPTQKKRKLDMTSYSVIVTRQVSLQVKLQVPVEAYSKQEKKNSQCFPGQNTALQIPNTSRHQLSMK